MLTDDEIAGYMGWRGPGAYTEHKMRKVKAAIAEAAARERESNNAEIAGLRDRVERLRGLCKSASGWLLDADDIEHSELIFDEAADGQSHLTGVLDADNDFEYMGRKLVDLGAAMQDKNTTIEELAALAFKAGLKLQFRIGD